MPRKESVAYEHSEPGNTPVVPVYSEPEKDIAIKSGSRRDSPPIAFEVIDLFIQNYPWPQA